MLRYLLPLTAIAAVLLTGTVHGLWTDRWQVSDEPAASASRLNDLAMTVGEWEGRTVSTQRAGLAGVAGHLYRRYTHARTGKEVTLFMVCGRPGPVAVHTPDVCYGASGFEVLSQVKYSLPATAGGAGAVFKTAQFRKKQSSDLTTLRIFWSWTATGPWSAPDDPRFTFVRYPALFKLYLIREMTSADEALDDDPCIDLMKQLLPALNKSLFPPS